MKRVLGFLVVLTLFVAVSTSHYVLAHGGGERGTEVCHVRSDTTLANGCTLRIGHIIRLPERGGSIRAHLAHGDFLVAEFDGFVRRTRRGCCILFVDQDGNPKPPPRVD